MSLESCSTCGYAVAIVDGSCRHCGSSTTAFATQAQVKAKPVVLIATVAVIVVIFLYRVFLH